MTNLVLAAIAAALVAGFRSFPIALVAGVAHRHRRRRELDRYVHQPGLGDSLPFIVIVVVLVVRGQALPLRDYFLQRLPSVGSGRINWAWIAFGVAVAVAFVHRGAQRRNGGRVHHDVRASAIILLSIVVLTGYAGPAVARPVRDRRLRRVGRRPPRRRAGHRRSCSALLAGVAATVPLGRALRPARRCARAASTWPSSRSASAPPIELMLFRQPRLHRRHRRHRRSATRSCSAGTSTSITPPGALRHLRAGAVRCSCALDRGQHPARAQRPAAASRCARTSAPPPRSASACRAPSSTRSACRPASRRSAASCSPSALTRSSTARSRNFTSITDVGLALHRRHRLPARAGLRRDAGRRRRSASRSLDDDLLRRRRQVHRADRRRQHPAHRAASTRTASPRSRIAQVNAASPQGSQACPFRARRKPPGARAARARRRRR